MIKKKKLLIVIVMLVIIGGILIIKSRPKATSVEEMKEISPTRGAIRNIISTTGTVLPKNRLEIKPPVNGRIESILVREGDLVKDGQTLAWMSSTERAALLDAAQGQGEAELKYWEDAYKPIALLAPIDAEVIVATTQPGQTVTTSDAVVVLSDQLIVRAQVDETDIGKVRLGQKAIVGIDAYPDTKMESAVEHMYYESKIVNNVTIYDVDLTPEEIPPFFRSGMNTTIDFIENSKENALLIPLEAVHKDNEKDFVLVRKNGQKDPVKQNVVLGISDDKNAEVLSGLSANDIIIINNKKFILPEEDKSTNPLTPFRRGRR